MSNRADTPRYDAFGDAEPAPPPKYFTRTERRQYAAAVAVFWSMALLLSAGRVHYTPTPGSPAIAAVAMTVASR